MSKEITKIINTLCEKLGVAASMLIPELAKKNIAQDIAMIIICTVVIASMVLIIKAIMSRCEKSACMDGFDTAFAIAIPAVALGIAFIVCGACICDLVGWLASPTAMAIKQISTMVR